MIKIFPLFMLLFIWSYSHSQTEEKVSKGGFIYSSPSIENASNKILCPKGDKIKIIEKNTIVNKDFYQVRYNYDYGSMFGYMLVEDIELAEKELESFDESEIVEVKKNENNPIKAKSENISINPKDEIIIKLNKSTGGTYYIPCTLNGLRMNFVFDTGASDVSLSLTEALFMFKNGYLKESDITGKQNYSIANGDIVEGTTIIIRELEFGGIKLENVKASISHAMEAPLLLGQSALAELGIIQIDYRNNTMKIIKE